MGYCLKMFKDFYLKSISFLFLAVVLSFTFDASAAQNCSELLNNKLSHSTKIAIATSFIKSILRASHLEGASSRELGLSAAIKVFLYAGLSQKPDLIEILERSAQLTLPFEKDYLGYNINPDSKFAGVFSKIRSDQEIFNNLYLKFSVREKVINVEISKDGDMVKVLVIVENSTYNPGYRDILPDDLDDLY